MTLELSIVSAAPFAIAYVSSALSILLLPMALPSDIFARLLRVMASRNSLSKSLSVTFPSPVTNSTRERFPSVIVPVLSLNKRFMYAESENAALWLTRMFFLYMDSVFMDCTRLFIIGSPSGTAIMTMDAISITASAAKSTTNTGVTASSALMIVSTTWRMPAIAAAETPSFPMPAATTSSFRLDVSFLSSSSESSVSALLIFPSSDASPTTVTTM